MLWLSARDQSIYWCLCLFNRHYRLLFYDQHETTFSYFLSILPGSHLECLFVFRCSALVKFIQAAN